MSTKWIGIAALRTTAAVVFAVLSGSPSAASSHPAVASADANRTLAGAEALQIPEWMKVDRNARLVQIEIVAGKTEFNNHWNFNGFAKGNATITVPEGYKVVIRFRNGDPSFPHSLGIGQRMEQFPPLFENPAPVFPGAMSSGATSLTDSTKPGEQETISFTASRAGDYAMLCYVPAHAIAGMWIHFRVSADGEVGFEAPTN
jgi:FtsP/CotA-like multicopper oxidase with cupredoxin domain